MEYSVICTFLPHEERTSSRSAKMGRSFMMMCLLFMIFKDLQKYEKNL